MLRIAGAVVVLITLAETLVLYPALRANGPFLAVAVAATNAALSLLVGYLVFNSVALVTRGGQPPASALKIVQDTLPVLRQGLNRETAAKTAEIISQHQDVLGVMVTDQEQVLALAGYWENTGWRDTVHTAALQAMRKGASRVVRVAAAPARGGAGVSAVLAPLRVKADVVGCLALMAEGLPREAEDLRRSAEIFAQFLSMQIELGQLDRQAQLAAEAELNALRAQINPHFLFNTLNTIVSYSREDPEMTRRLLLRLADLFRNTMQLGGQILPFAEEYQHVRNYLFIEQARYRDRLRVVYDVDPQVLKVGIPALSVQPLVENAVRHGIAPKQGVGTVQVRARLDFLTLRVEITVEDDGVGIPPQRVPELLQPRAGGRGRSVGLSNINERLKRLYGESFHLRIWSKPGQGTRVQFRIPMR